MNQTTLDRIAKELSWVLYSKLDREAFTIGPKVSLQMKRALLDEAKHMHLRCVDAVAKALKGQPNFNKLRFKSNATDTQYWMNKS